MKHLKIKPIQPEDNESTALMIRNVFHEFDAPQKGTVYSDTSTDSLYEYFDEKDNSALWVLKDDEKVWGSCGIYPTQGLPHDTVELVKFYIAPEARGYGYGKKLLNLSLQTAKDLGYKNMYLETIQIFNQSIKLYSNYGFKFIEQSLGDTGHFSCEIKMLKKL